MNNKLTTFQIILFGVLISAIIVGVILFAVTKQSEKNNLSEVDVWGVLPLSAIDNLEQYINDKEDDDVIKLTYTEFSDSTFEAELLEALASGTGPDMVIFPSDFIFNHENKLFLLDYEFYPQKQFQDSFIEAGEVLMRNTGIVGLPLAIDPLVLYWNRTILNNVGISLPPEHWDQLLEMVPKIVVRDSALNITRLAVAMGEFQNVDNAKEILISLIQQAGNPIIILGNNPGSEDAVFKSILTQRFNYKLRPVDTALNFFIQFSNPSKDVYSWNKSLSKSRDVFLAGDMAFYFGFASEYASLLEKNPNLNIGVAQLPQSRSSAKKTTLGKMYSIAILNASDDIRSSFSAMSIITEPDNNLYLADELGLAPVRREVLTEVFDSALKDVFNTSALISKVFLDPDTLSTHNIFQTMVESIVVGTNSVSGAVDRADGELNVLLQ